MSVAALALSSGAALADDKPEGAEPRNQDCLQCHSDAVGEKLPEVRAIDLAKGPHNEENGVSCVSCHTRAAKVADVSAHGALGPASCDGCHDAGKAVAASVHGRPAAGKKQPTCTSCHGDHDLRKASDAASRVAARAQVKTCGACHNGQMSTNYQLSVHGRMLERGKNAPACSTCHGGHAISAADVRHNGPFKQSMAETCGKCHAQELARYKPSVHGQALLERSNFDSASCVDCHRSHEILPPSDPNSAVYPTKVVEDCARCHADTRLIRRSALPSQVVKTYEMSYHGRAGELGSTAVANCASCHTSHGIFRSSDRRSSVHPDNLQGACGKCHTGANRNFIQGRIHVVDERESNFAAWVVKNIYTLLIVLIIGAMVVHNALDFGRKMLIKARRQRAQPHIVRMTVQERIAHFFLLTSFLILVYSGFALMFPHAWWVTPLNWISGSEQFRRWVHRGAGLELTLITLYHIWFLFFHPRGREQRRQFAPRRADLTTLWQNLLFYLGRRKERPAFPRFSYMEKAEYWALVWGTVVMVLTGLVMWFQTSAMGFMPRWLWEIFQVIHRYEAILAALAILVWHFYFIFLNPDDAPMSLTWLTGRISVHELALQHGGELAELRASGRLQPATEDDGEGMMEEVGKAAPAKQPDETDLAPDGRA